MPGFSVSNLVNKPALNKVRSHAPSFDIKKDIRSVRRQSDTGTPAERGKIHTGKCSLRRPFLMPAERQISVPECIIYVHGFQMPYRVSLTNGNMAAGNNPAHFLLLTEITISSPVPYGAGFSLTIPAEAFGTGSSFGSEYPSNV